MSTQISVRLPDKTVAFLDASIKDGMAASRAELVVRALDREMRYQAALRDVAILQAQPDVDDDLDDLVSWTAQQPIKD